MPNIESALRNHGIDVKKLDPKPSGPEMQKWLKECKEGLDQGEEFAGQDVESPYSIEPSRVIILDQREIGGQIETKIGYLYSDNEHQCLAAYVFDTLVDLEDPDALIRLVQSINPYDWEEVDPTKNQS